MSMCITQCASFGILRWMIVIVIVIFILQQREIYMLSSVAPLHMRSGRGLVVKAVDTDIVVMEPAMD